MKIRVNYFMCDEPELFIPEKDWKKYFPSDDRAPDDREYALHLTDEQFKGLLVNNATPSHDLATDEAQGDVNINELVRTLETFTAKIKDYQQ